MGYSPEPLSGVAVAILSLAGVSLSLILGIVGLLLFRCLRRASGFLRPAQPTGKVKKPTAKQQSKQPSSQQTQQLHAAHAEPLERGKNLKELIKANKDAEKSKKAASKDDHASGHALFLNTLKGHGDSVHSVAWNTEGTQIATACEDMMVRVFELTDVTSRSPKFKTIRTTRLPVGAGFGDNTDEMIVLMQGTSMAILAAYGPSTDKVAARGPYEQKWKVESVHGKEAPLSICTVPSAAACARKGFAISCSQKKDARVFSLQGKQLAVLDPNSLLNHSLVVSRDGRFAAVACFTSEIRLWELKWAKDTGEFRGAFKAMELKGHKKKIMCADLSADNKRAVTVSEDGTLRVWNINVRYDLEEDAKSTLVIAMPLPQGKVYEHIAFGADGVLAASVGNLIHLISADRGDLLEAIDAHDGAITSLEWCPRKVRTPGSAAPHAVLASSSHDKRVRLWRWPAS